ncbi:MAG: hypothetical protein EOS28_16875 [Mesorhizobium sp.]|nr:MAG: hypothetical protein EOS28_16875 [Mesorhizobium sp.]
MDIVDITDRFEIDRVARELAAEIIKAIDKNISDTDRSRYSVFLDIAQSNLKYELNETSKGEYGAFVTLVSETIGEEYCYDRDLLFLLWGLVARRRWINTESIVDWMFEVVEIYFQRKGWEINNVYRNVFNTLSSQNIG